MNQRGNDVLILKMPKVYLFIYRELRHGLVTPVLPRKMLWWLTLLASWSAIYNPVEAGCRYTNPEWDMNHTQTSAPSIQAGLTPSGGVEMLAKWNESLITLPTCVDKIQLWLDTQLICTVAPQEQKCQSSEIRCPSENTQPLDFWLTLVNEDHKDGVQSVRAPSVTQIVNFCADNPSILIAESESCEAIVPSWSAEPEVEYLRGRRGRREIKMKWKNSNIMGHECLDSFEIKYWPQGKTSRSFVTSAIQARKGESKVYSSYLEVDECQEYRFVIRASKKNPSVVINHRGQFQSKCKSKPKNLQNKATKTTTSAPKRIIFTTKATTTSSTTTTTTTTKTTTTTTTTTTIITTTIASTTTKQTTMDTSFPTTVSTIQTSSTQTTRLTSMLFNSSPEESLEEMLFQAEDEEPTTPTPKLENFDKSTTLKSTTLQPSTSTEKMMKDEPEESVKEPFEEPFEYVENGIEEDRKYLESAISVPTSSEASQENRDDLTSTKSRPTDDATDFDELLAKTRESSGEKNPRSLQFDQSYNGVGRNIFPDFLLNSGMFLFLVVGLSSMMRM